jgi:outer membrane protein TolC
LNTTVISLCFCFVRAAWAQPDAIDAQRALQLAAQHRPKLQAAKLRVEQARISARAIGTYLATKLGVGYSTDRDIGSTDQDAFISQPIDLFGRTKAGRQSGAALVQQAEAAYRGELIDLQTDVLTALTEAVSAVKLSITADSVLQNAEQLKAAVDRRVEEGKVAEVQQTRAAIEVMRAQQNSDLRRSQKFVALKRLSAQLGVTVAAEEVNAFPTLGELATVDISQRPDVLLTKADVQAAKAEASIAKASVRPDLEIQGLRLPWHEGGARFGARIQLSWAVFDFGRARNEVRSAQTKALANEQALEDIRLTAVAELSATREELLSAKTQVESYRNILESARNLVDKTRIGYEEGASTLIDVLEATRSLREVEEGSVQAEQRVAEASISDYRAAGIVVGGWN